VVLKPRSGTDFLHRLKEIVGSEFHLGGSDVELNTWFREADIRSQRITRAKRLSSAAL